MLLTLVLAVAPSGCKEKATDSAKTEAEYSLKADSAAADESADTTQAKEEELAPHEVSPEVAPPSAGAELDYERNTMEVFEAAGPATVYVTQTRLVRDRYTRRALEVPAGSGTGFIWDSEGHIVTNFHVVDGAQKLSVTLYNQKSYEASFVGGEPRRDIAVLKIDAPAEELQAIRLPKKGSELAVGQKAIAIGNPFGLDHTLTVGVISALGREVMGYGEVTIPDMIQTDASINPGNSGGPLLNSRGELIGMNTMIFSKSGSSNGIGFAVPEPTIARLVPQLIKTGKAEQVGLGITILSDRIARRAGIKGVVIESVAPSSPAEQAGLKGLSADDEGVHIGDVIVGIEEVEIHSYDDLYNALEGRLAGESVVVHLRRGDEKAEVKVELYTLD